MDPDEAVAVAARPDVLVHDTKGRSGAVLTISPSAWHGFIRSLREG
ncbi:DUF397 domain-containing protein [Phytomonospora endophytica]